jgi:hypothetical protein
MKILELCVFIFFLLCASSNTFGEILQMPHQNLGPNRIPSNQVKNYQDQNITACGIASYPVVSLHGIDIGEPGMGGTVGADLIMILPADLAIETYFGKNVCVSGVVKFMTFLNSQVPTITVRSQQDIVILGR